MMCGRTNIRTDDLLSVADSRQATLTSVHELHHGRPPCEPRQRRYNSSVAAAMPTALWESSQLQRRKKREIKKDTSHVI